MATARMGTSVANGYASAPTGKAIRLTDDSPLPDGRYSCLLDALVQLRNLSFHSRAQVGEAFVGGLLNSLKTL